MKRYLDQRLRLQLLRVIDALEIHGSLLKASAAIGISQPALTKSLKDLEDLVGTRLFDRHPRGVTPTESGMVLVRSGRRILAELRRTEEDLDHLANPYGGIAAIGALPVAAASLTPIIVSRLRRESPDFRVRIEKGRTEELLPLLAAGQIDLVIGRFYEPPTPDDFVRERLWNDPIALVARTGHPLLDPAKGVETFADYELVLPVTPQRVAFEIDVMLNLLGLEGMPSTQSTSYDFTREILLSTDSFSILPPMVVLGDINRQMLGVRALPLASTSRPAGIITVRDRKLNDAALAFIAAAREDIKSIVASGLAELTSSEIPTKQSLLATVTA